MWNRNLGVIKRFIIIIIIIIIIKNSLGDSVYPTCEGWLLVLLPHL
jgi:hypothetical protein